MSLGRKGCLNCSCALEMVSIQLYICPSEAIVVDQMGSQIYGSWLAQYLLTVIIKMWEAVAIKLFVMCADMVLWLIPFTNPSNF